VEIVVPKQSILAEPPIALVTKNAEAHGTRAVAEAYLKFLYSPQAQNVIARNYFRPRDPRVAQRYGFPKLKLVDIRLFGGWQAAQRTFFADGGIFDQIYQPK